MSLRGRESDRRPDTALSLPARLEARLRGSNRRISQIYEHAAWLSLIAGVVLWEGFIGAGLGFYLGSMALRREGL